jgi:hypothetical protein
MNNLTIWKNLRALIVHFSCSPFRLYFMLMLADAILVRTCRIVSLFKALNPFVCESLRISVNLGIFELITPTFTPVYTCKSSLAYNISMRPLSVRASCAAAIA